MRTQWLLPVLGLCASSFAARNGQADQLRQWLHGRSPADVEYQAFEEPTVHARASTEHRFLNDKTESESPAAL